MSEDTITVELDINETSLISALMRKIIAEVDTDDDQQLLMGEVALSVQQKLIDAVVFDGKVPIEHLPPPPEGDDD